MADTKLSSVTLINEVARLDPQARRELATALRQVSATLHEVPDGKAASYVLGVLAHLLDRP
jgi:hypothetical protein